MSRIQRLTVAPLDPLYAKQISADTSYQDDERKGKRHGPLDQKLFTGSFFGRLDTLSFLIFWIIVWLLFKCLAFSIANLAIAIIRTSLCSHQPITARTWKHGTGNENEMYYDFGLTSYQGDNITEYRAPPETTGREAEDRSDRYSVAQSEITISETKFLHEATTPPETTAKKPQARMGRLKTETVALPDTTISEAMTMREVTTPSETTAEKTQALIEIVAPSETTISEAKTMLEATTPLETTAEETQARTETIAPSEVTISEAKTMREVTIPPETTAEKTQARTETVAPSMITIRRAKTAKTDLITRTTSTLPWFVPFVLNTTTMPKSSTTKKEGWL
ncbi:unnamed protein product [Ceutorhynchus assimilis]|uniref:Uncharacterized protein n=1 Tax=Ceutorhynchus assimilis TaxID=467358 RepID=A0A9N9MQE6_9CUCU|nr:unnamed protein product [Ceutorhynchus assimilis]